MRIPGISEILTLTKDLASVMLETKVAILAIHEEIQRTNQLLLEIIEVTKEGKQ